MSHFIGEVADAFYLVMWVYLAQRYLRGYRLEWRRRETGDAQVTHAEKQESPNPPGPGL